MGHFHEELRELGPPTRELRRRIPEAYAGFLELARGAVAEGDIPARIKEVMAVAIAVTHGCKECIAHHAKAAVRHGATEQEMAEGLGVALLMAGGPASTMAPTAWRAFQEFREDVEPAAS